MHEEEWVMIIEANRDALVTTFEKMELPEFMTGDDVVQDVYLDILERQLYEEMEIDTGFFVSKGRYLARDAMKRDRGRLRTDEDGVYARRVFLEFNEDLVKDYVVDDSTEATICRDILNKMSADNAKLLILHYIEGFTLRELEAALGLSRSTLDRRIQEALEEARGVADS
jgi:RNA polymerase sigma factor (sigma-70 family)